MHYDTVIIGAGMSGLSAGVRLAYFEKNVCILERHTTIGGLNSFYRLRKRNYDVGLHAVTNYAEPGSKGGPLSKLLRQLRMKWEDFDLRPQLQSSIAFPDCTLRFTNDFALLLDQIATAFPKQIDGFRRLLSVIDNHDALDLENRKNISARKVLGEHISDPLLIDMLFCPLMFYGSPTPRDMDFSQFVIMFKSIFYEGFGRPFDGIRLILKKLVRHFKSLGGHLKLRAGVSEIKQSDGKAKAVILDDGTEITADNVLSSAGAAETMRMVDPTRPAKRPIPGDISFVESISVLDCEPSSLGHNDTIVFYNDAPSFHYERPQEPIDLRSGIICSPNNFDYSRPLEDGRVRITALAEPDYWINMPEDEYAQQKMKWNDRIIESALKHIPDFRSHVIDTDVFTPRTIRRFTGHDNGCVYGAPEKFVDGQTPVRNLYLCGTDQGFLGIVGAMLSGITIANRYLLK
ncbi:phytoene desaturase family protein [Fuerstiella marisgermanici]|uniref:Soluble pyridine nucleotide transhydrogenase n=1 Tax=Fuerstiella marisgermanici TaxID=1891926 RepID=A0A1P8WPY3_9PLAN|nr:NAD(P)/FAD-dependent oxidoreductase [Fuerstiella marisgermanici]APZ96120.1 soluble pyridine nucleotide transhydrogenase [Fuerstiella marisgermanici]